MSREHLTQLHNITDLVKGAIGCGSTMLGIITSNLESIEAWLRVTSLLVGIAVGLATFLSILRRRK